VAISWAIVLEGRSDAAGILLLLEDQEEAVSIAKELRHRGQPVVVRRCPIRVTESADGNRY
jgi:hypothetical protein